MEVVDVGCRCICFFWVYEWDVVSSWIVGNVHSTRNMESSELRLCGNSDTQLRNEDEGAYMISPVHFPIP